MDELLGTIQDAANTIATPNWADIVGVFVSLAALFVAGFVAWRQNIILKRQNIILKRQTDIMNTQTSIAENQNRIALFEKRLEIYDLLTSCRASVELLKLLGNNDDVLELLFASLVRKSEDYREYSRDYTTNAERIYLINCYSILKRATFFFSEKVASYIIDVSNKLFTLSKADIKADGIVDYNKKKQAYFDAIRSLEENKVFESIEAEMKMI